jgi:hypothetical protein
MKSSKTKFIIILILSSIILINSKKLKKKATPKAENLSNHYGTEPVDDKYGPKVSAGFNLMREGSVPGAPTTPIMNFEKEINPTQVVSGDLTNTSADASKIISAPLAKPKAEIQSTITHEAIVKTPVHLATHVEQKTVTTMNRMTGKVNSKSITTEKPVVGILNTVREVNTPHTTVVDLTTGKLASGPGPAVNHGIS